jgi:hypothetical protein
MQQISPWMLKAVNVSTALKLTKPSYHPPLLYALRGADIMANAREQVVRGEMEIERAYQRLRG